MKILFISHYLPPHTGGIEYVVENQMKSLRSMGHTVQAVASSASGDAEASGYEYVKAWNGLEKYGVPYPVFDPWQLYQSLKEEVRSADVVHAHGGLYMGSVISGMLCKMYQTPLVVTEHVGFVPYRSRIISTVEAVAFGTIGKFVFEQASCITVLNRRVEAFVGAYTHQDKIQILQNGVDTKRFISIGKSATRRLRTQLGLPSSRPLVLYAGRYVEKKGVDEITGISGGVADLVLAGPGFDASKFRTRDHIHVMGKVSQEVMSQLYRACDMLVIASHGGEGFPLVVQEAVASELPVLIYGTYEKELYSEYVSLSFEDDDITFGVKKVLRTSTNESFQKRMKKDRRRQISWSQHAEQLCTLYEQVMDDA